METSDVSNKYFIYVLFSLKDKKLYIGYTANIKNRLKEHISGKVLSTKSRRPFKLIYFEYFTNIYDAKAREKYLKSGFGRSQLKLALKTTLKNLNYKHQ